MPTHTFRRAALSAALTFLVLTSCSRNSGGRSGSAGKTGSAAGTLPASPVATTPPMATTTPAAGMSAQPMNRTAPRDSNQAFLRMRADRQQALIVMVDSAMPKLDAAGKATASKVREEQRAEQQTVLRMLMKRYKDSITPAVMPSDQQMIAAVAAASGTDADRVFYQQVIAHHQSCVQMAEGMLPQLSGETKQFATKSIAEQNHEIAELQKKVSAMH